METPARDLDEDALDAAIADLLSAEAPENSSGGAGIRSEFPDLKPQKVPEAEATIADGGIGGILRQKWAQLSGAA